MDIGSFPQAVRALHEGRAVIFPTDTVCGLGVAVAFSPSPRVLYDLKRRDEGKPVAWLVGSAEDLTRFGKDVPAFARAAAERFWPGALTLVVKASDEVPEAYRSAQGTIGLRMPAAATARALIEATESPLATTSANVSGAPDTPTLENVDAEVAAKAGAVLDDPSVDPCGRASTVVDCTGEAPVVLREGSIAESDLFAALFGEAVEPGGAKGRERGASEGRTGEGPAPESLAFASHGGGCRVNALLWAPPSRPVRGVVHLVHGMAEYIERYEPLARFLVDRGFAVCGMDMLGHGRTAPSADERGHIPPDCGYRAILDDVHEVRRAVSQRFPEAPYFLYGHSMGSFIVRTYLAEHPEGVAGAVLSGTGNPPAALAAFGGAAARAIIAARGPAHRSALLDRLGVGGYGRSVKNARTPLDWISADEREVDAYLADPLCGFMFSAGGYAVLSQFVASAVSPETARRIPSDLPVLFVSGDEDPVGERGRGVRRAAALLADAGVRDVRVKLYAGARHEPHNDHVRDRLFADVLDFLEERIDG